MIKNLLYCFFIVFSIILNAYGKTHTVKVEIKTFDANGCQNSWCQVYLEIPAKLYIDKGWLRKDLKNLRFNDGSRDLTYWVIPKEDGNYDVNKLGLWLLVYDLKPNDKKYIDMVIDDIDDNNNTVSYCNPRAGEYKSDDRSSYECAAATFRFYSYNLDDWKLSKSPSDNAWDDKDTKFINNYLYTLDTIEPGLSDDGAKTGNEFTLHIDNVKFYEPEGDYYSELIIYFLSQAPAGKAGKLPKSPGYRLYIKKASDFDNVSDDFHYSRYHFVINLQQKREDKWITKAKADWYPYNNSRYVFDIKVSRDSISLWINGEHYAFRKVKGDVNSDGDFIRDDSWNSGFFGFDRKGWRLCCGTDVNYIILRHYYREEPKVEIYGATDVVVGKGEANKGENIIEIVPDVQRVSSIVGGDTLDKYIFAKYDLPNEMQYVKDFVLKIRNRDVHKHTFNISNFIETDQNNGWVIYWCNVNGSNCSLRPPESVEIPGNSSVNYLIKIFPKFSTLFNGGIVKLHIAVESGEDGSFDNALFTLRVNPKLSCYWKYKLPVKVTWQPAYGYKNLYDYQILVNVKNTDELQYAKSDGSDVIVTDGYGNIVPFWIKKFDVSKRELNIWIKVPKLEEGNNTIYVWWGNANFSTPLSNKKRTFDLFEDWSDYSVNSTVGCPDGTEQCDGFVKDLDNWVNTPTPDDFYNWWIIREKPSGNKILQADIYRDGKAIDVHNGLCDYEDYKGKSCDKGPYLFNGNVHWDHYEVLYEMNSGTYCQYSGCEEPWGNPQYNPVFVMDAGNMWGMEFFADKFIFRPYASGIDYVWQYQTYPKDILGEPFPKRDKWYWVKVRVFKDKLSGKAYLRVRVAKDKPEDVDSDSDFTEIANFTAPPAFSLPYGKIGFGGWDSGFYFDNIRVRKYVIGSDGKEPTPKVCSINVLSPREKISLSQPQITPPLFEGRSAYIVTETKPFSWLGDLKAYYADCYLSGKCSEGERQDKPGTISLFGKIDDEHSKGLGFYLMKAKPGLNNRSVVCDEDWIDDGRFILTHLDDRETHDFNGFDYFEMNNCDFLKAYLGVNATCDVSDGYNDDAEKLIEFVRGFYVSYFPKSKGRSMDKVEGYGNSDGIDGDDEQWKLGDILHSNPLIVGIPNMVYSDESYWEFVKEHRDRPLVVYFMSNDGMLHAFEIAKYDSEALVPRYKPLSKPIELWSYIPEAVLSHLKDLTGYSHEYVADGLLRAIDVKDEEGNWKTILIGSGGRGGKYIFAIDITNPHSPKFLWELNSKNNPEIMDNVGMAISSPALGKLGDRWVAVFGSGYSEDFIENYSKKKAYLTVVDILTGEVLRQIKVNDKIGNVLTDIATMRDVNGNIRKIYFGDYYGAVWEVNATELQGDNVLTKNNMLFKPWYYDSVSEPSESLKPITAMPILAKDGKGNWWVYVGTGDYDEYNPDYPHQSFYGLMDNGTRYYDSENCSSDSLFCGNLKNVTNSANINDNSTSWILMLGFNDENDTDYTGNNTSEKNSNERVLRKAIVYGGYVFFTTYQPKNDPCGGGISRFYALKYDTGQLGSGLFRNPSYSGTGNDEYLTIRSIELKSSGVPSQPMIYTGNSGVSQVVAVGLVSSSTGELEKVFLNPSAFIKNIDILLWRRKR